MKKKDIVLQRFRGGEGDICGQFVTESRFSKLQDEVTKTSPTIHNHVQAYTSETFAHSHARAHAYAPWLFVAARACVGNIREQRKKVNRLSHLFLELSAHKKVAFAPSVSPLNRKPDSKAREGSTVGQNQVILRQRIIHFPMSSRVSEQANE